MLEMAKELVFPARVGMNRMFYRCDFHQQGVPRSRGDEPSNRLAALSSTGNMMGGGCGDCCPSRVTTSEESQYQLSRLQPW